MIKRKILATLMSAKTFIMSKNALIFLMFLIISFCFWCLQSMRKKYDIDVNIKISYVNVPVSNINEEDLPHLMTATLREQGYYIFLYKNRDLEIVLDFDNFSYNNHTYSISSELLLNKLKDIIMQSTLVESFSPNEIHTNMVTKVGKVVPVRFSGSATYSQQYCQSDTITIVPMHVEIFGDKNILDTISCIYTEDKKYTNLKETVTERIKLAPMRNISYSQSNVNITIPVERFTERTVNMQISNRNVPASITLRTFPTNVNVNYFVSASKYSTNDNIEVYVDYDDVAKNSNGKLVLHTKTSNPFISNIRCQPAEVDFLIEK